MKVRPKAVDHPPERSARGRVITFYSYKGGTGRSMAMANVAWMLALNGERVLVIDWDLEAPGLHRYFHPFLKDKELTATDGLLDFVVKQAARAAVSKEREKQAAEPEKRNLENGEEAADPGKVTGEPETASDQFETVEAEFDTLVAEPADRAKEPPAISREYSRKDESAIIDYLVPLVWPNDIQWQQFGPRARIDLLPAGRQGPSYSRTLGAFNWIDFFERLDGRSVLLAARQQLRSVYDFILIDSRTGVSDTSGICTVEMPDTLVIGFTLNDQSILGASGIADSILTQRRERGAANPMKEERPFLIFPVPMRVEALAEHVKRQVALELAQEKFSRFLDARYQKELSIYWGSAQMAYYPYYAFEEIPCVFGDTPNVDISLTNSIKKITGYLTDQTITTLPLLDSDPIKAEQRRKEIVGWFSRSVSPVRASQAAFDQFDVPRQQTMLKVLQRLVQVDAKGQDSVRRCGTEEFPEAWQEVIRTLADLRVIEITRAGDGAETVALSDSVILEKWELLRKAIHDERPFLVWRQSLSASAKAWLTTGRDRSALWRGKLAEESKRWSNQHFDDLNQLEKDFLTQSLEEARKENRMESLETVAVDQRLWSMTANRLKRSIEQGRLIVLGLGIAGAILAALAAHLHNREVSPYTFSQFAGYAGSAALAVAVVVRAQFLGRERLQAWILARAASESFKREMYYYRTSSGAYSDDQGNPDSTLFERRDEILGKITSLQKYVVSRVPQTAAPLGPLDANAYISERVTGPINWFRGRADRYSATQGSWQNVEYLLSIGGALLGAALTYTGNQAFGAWVAVITTISGSVGAHVLAERYEQLTVSYRATADRLTGILGRWRAGHGTLGQLVEQVESALLQENQAWIAGADDLLKDLVPPPQAPSAAQA